MSDNEGVSVTLDQSNAQSNSSMMPPQEGDSQQAAEAMVQLSGVQSQFYQTAEESMEIDPNYDPSDFLGMSNRQLGTESAVQPAVDPSQFTYQQASAFDPNFQQFQQQPSQFEDQQIMAAEGQQQEQQAQQPSALPPLQSLHKDLAISDSDDEQHNLQMDIFNNANENDDNDDGGDLWF